MKTSRLSFFLMVLVLLSSMSGIAQDKAVHKYVGVQMCAPCHKTEKQGKQYDIWKGSKHAEAFHALETPSADSIARAKGLKTAAKESPECLRCHVTGYAVEAKSVATAIKPTDGVQCETCHGPGSNYKSLSVMKDRQKAIAAGLTIFKDDPKLCTKCHNAESPTFKGFKYDEYWSKIKHPLPKKG